MLRRRAPGSGSPGLVIVGLGNPGPSYAKTRHNVGANVVERLSSELGVDLGRTRGQVRVGHGRLEDIPIALGIPTTYMNDSGGPVAKLVRKEGVKPEALIVCHDELDIPLGRVRLKVGGGTAGHQGLNSICASLRSKDFLRIRVGIGRPEPGDDATGKVLSAPPPHEREELEAAIERAVEGLHVLAREGVDAAQRFLHVS